MGHLASASSFAPSIDHLITLVTWMVGFWFTLTAVMFFWLIWRFRAKPGVKTQYIEGHEAHVKRWISWPHVFVLVCDVVIIVAAMRVWYNIKQAQPPADAGHEIRVIGQQWAWVFQYPGPDDKFDTGDDFYTTDNLYVENQKTYHFQLRSRDVIHDFSVPAFRLKQDAVPGRTITGWFKPTLAGTYDIQCAEICGLGHGVMAGKIHVQDAADYQQFIQQHTAQAVSSAQ
jgi:cytochrome c oxidase subunit 2